MRIDFYTSLFFVHFPLLIQCLPSAPYAWLRSPRGGDINSAHNLTSIDPVLQLLNTTQITPIFPVLQEILYRVHGTPVILHITLRDPPIPVLYLNAFLTTVLRQIARKVQTQGDSPIPRDRFMYSDRITGAGFAYVGLSESHRITWQMLSWTLEV